MNNTPWRDYSQNFCIFKLLHSANADIICDICFYQSSQLPLENFFTHTFVLTKACKHTLMYKIGAVPLRYCKRGESNRHVSCLIAAPNAKNLQNHALTKLQMKAWWEALCPVFVNCCPRVTHSKRTIVSTHLHWRVCVSCPQWCWHQCVPTYESLITPRGKGKHICLGSDTSNLTWRQEELHKRAGGDKNTLYSVYWSKERDRSDGKF